MHGQSNPESGLDITMLDGDLGAVTDPSRIAAPVLSADACVCWPPCVITCTVAVIDE